MACRILLFSSMTTFRGRSWAMEQELELSDIGFTEHVSSSIIEDFKFWEFDVVFLLIISGKGECGST